MEKKNEFLFLDHNNLEIQDVTERINEIISKDSTILYKRGNINEWINLDDRYLISWAAKPHYISFVKYVDELYSNLFDKMKLINTLANMIVVAQIPIENIEINSLYVLTDYFQDIKASEYHNQYKVIGNKEILLITRYNTLDAKKRVGMLKYIIDQAKKRGLDYNNNEKVLEFIEVMKKEISTIKADKLLNN